MNKRSFLKSLLVASVAPTLLIAASKDAFKWKVSKKSGLYIINPEWLNAKYEVAFLFPPNMGDVTVPIEKMIPVIHNRSYNLVFRCMKEHYPLRLNDINHPEQYIYPFKEI